MIEVRAYARLPFQEDIAQRAAVLALHGWARHGVNEGIRNAVVEDSPADSSLAEDQQRQLQAEEDSGLEIVPGAGEDRVRIGVARLGRPPLPLPGLSYEL